MSVNTTEESLQEMLAEWNVLAERYDQLKEYLMRPVKDARNRPLGSDKSDEQALQEAKVLPEYIYEAMAGAFHKAEKDLETLETKMADTNRFAFGTNVTIVPVGIRKE
jgi:hypothetical protein